MFERQAEQKQTETDRMIGDVVIFGLIGAVGILFFLPVLLGMLFFAIGNILKRNWIPYFMLGTGILILFWQVQSGNVLLYFGLISEMNVPYLSTGIEKLLNNGDSIPTTSSSYWTLGGLAFLFSFVFFVFTKYFWKRRVKTKSGEVEKKKQEEKYKAFRKNRVQFLNKKQQQYRKQPSTEVFVGYTDFKERVSLNSKELNYHMLVTGGTGTGKTTLIASLMESTFNKISRLSLLMVKGNESRCLSLRRYVKHTAKTSTFFLKWITTLITPSRMELPQKQEIN